MRDTETTLEELRKRQALVNLSAPLRFVLETSDTQSTAQLEQAAQALLNLSVSTVPLFPESQDDEELRRYFLLEIPGGQGGITQADRFQLSYRLLDGLTLRSCEPDLETDFAHEGDARQPTESGLGGVIGCLVDKEPPPQPDWALKTMRVLAAWDIPPPDGGNDRGEGILIGQIDTGVNEHNELDDEALVLRHGANFIEGGAALPIDPLVKEGLADNPGHGISTASVVISRDLHNDVITGAAPKAKMLPVRAIRSVIRVTQSTVAQGVDYAHRQGAHVITMSLGGLPSLALRAAIRRAVRDNLIVLAAAGNCVRTVTYPARFRDCIAVAGINVDGRPWRGSCRGQSVDVSAPAELVYRASRNSPGAPVDQADGEGQGTSYAVALTAGVAALWLAHFGRSKLIASLRPGETLQDRFRSLIKRTARIPTHGEWDFSDFGAGIINAEELLKADSFSSSARESAVAQASDEAEISEEIGNLVAESTGMRPDDLGMSLAQRSRYSLELATLSLNFAARQPAPTEASSIGPKNLVSNELFDMIDHTVSASLKRLLKDGATPSGSINPTSSPLPNPSGTDRTMRPVTPAVNRPGSRDVTPLMSVSNMESGSESNLQVDPPGVGKRRYGKGGAQGQEALIASDGRLLRGRTLEPPKTRVIPADSLTLIETIIGQADGRVRIDHTEVDPWRRICCLEITGPLGSGTGTGWLVGPRTIITAGHCVFDRRMGGWATRIRVIPGRDDFEEPFPNAVTTATRFSSIQRWVHHSDRGYDIGAIHLDKPIGDIVGWFGFASLAAAEMRQYGVNIAGYAGDLRFTGRKLAFHSGRVMQVDERRIYYDADTKAGQSGGPVWLYTDEQPDEPVVVGIHAYGEGATPLQFDIEANSAPRILPDMYDLIEAWIAQDEHVT